MTVTLSKTSSSRGWQVRTLELQIDPSRAAAAGGTAVHCAAASFEAAAPPTGRIKSARFERNEQPSIMLLSSAHVIISSELIPRSIFMPPKTLGLTTQWQMICQTRALVICVTTINWRTTRQGLKKDRSFYIDLNRLTAKWTIVFWHW